MITLNNLMSTSVRDNIPQLFMYMGLFNKLNIKVSESIGNLPRIKTIIRMEHEFLRQRNPAFHYIIDDNVVAQFIKLYD